MTARARTLPEFAHGEFPLRARGSASRRVRLPGRVRCVFVLDQCCSGDPGYLLLR